LRRRAEIPAAHLKIDGLRCDRPVGVQDTGPPNRGCVTHPVMRQTYDGQVGRTVRWKCEGIRRVHRGEQFEVLYRRHELVIVEELVAAHGHRRVRFDSDWGRRRPGHEWQHLAPVVPREPLPGDGDAGRERIPEAQTVGEGAKGVQPGVGHDPPCRSLPRPPGACC
jgi:hypothetical protein